jgi:YesN/AraC family two-component response regulator
MKKKNQYMLDKILVVEDDLILVENLCSMLEIEGFHVYSANNGLEALKLIQSKRIALILSDISMPVMDGIELLKNIKSNKKYTHIPFIFLTAKTALEDKLMALDLMADDFITKPFVAQEIIFKCRNNIDNRKKVIQSFLNKSQTEETYTSRDQKFLTELKIFIDKNISNESLSLKDLGNAFPMSTSSIQKHVKRILGKSIFQFILETRLHKAKEILDNKALNVTEVIAVCGFKNHNYFTKKFKEYYDTLPSKLKLGDYSNQED